MSEDVAKLSRFPWATFGRPEAWTDLFRKVEAQRGRVALMPFTPRFSIVIAPGEGSTAAMDDLLASVRAQSYPHWEIVMAEATGADSVRRNEAARRAKGDWLLFPAPDDVLNPVALYEMALALQGKPTARPAFLYANETKLVPGGRGIAEFHSKPEPSWINLSHFNYVGAPWAVDTSVFRRLRGFRENAGSHNEHEFLLRVFETEKIHSLPQFLAHRRGEWFSPPDETTRKIVRDSLKRREMAADVVLETHGSRSRLKIRPAAPPKGALVSTIVCFRDKADWTVRCLEELGRHRGKIPLEVILVDNGSKETEREKVITAAAKSPVPARVVTFDAPFNFARMHNWAVEEHVKGNFLFLLNNDVFLQGEWNLDEMVAWAAQDWCGTVGIQLRYPQGGVQHGGLRARFGGEARMARVGHEYADDLFTWETRETFGNTFAASIFSRKIYETLGGLRELDVPNGFGDVVFNLECKRRGFRNLYLGHLSGLHLESATRGLDYEYWEECIIEAEYPELLQRMLRRDLGINRTPGADLRFGNLVRQAVHGTLEQAAPQLLPLKAKARKWLVGAATMMRRLSPAR